MRILALMLLVAGCGLAGCGCNGPHGSVRAPRAGGDVLVVLSPEPERLPFDPRGARLAAATAELAGVCGHPVAFVIDGSLAEETRSGFESQLIAGVESLARAAARLKDTDPEAYSYAAPLLQRVVCKYRAAAHQPTVRLDAAGNTLHVLTAGRDGALVSQPLAERAMLEAYERYAADRYADASPQNLPASERAAYYRYLDDTRSMNADSRGGGISEARGTRMLRMFELERVVGDSDPTLAEVIRTWLWGHRGYFVDAYNHHYDAAVGAPSGSAFRRAEAAFVSWLQRRLPGLSDQHKLAWANDVFAPRAGGRGYVRASFQGFDKLGFALTIVDDWIRDGHPTQADGARRNLLQEFMVCPHPADASGHRSLGPRCDHDLYRYAFESEQDTARLVDEVLRRGDPILAETLFVAALYSARSGEAQALLTRLWRRTEDHEAVWKIGAKVIAEELSETSERASLTDELRRLWRAYPARRGALLVVIARADPYDHGAIAWGDFARDYGSLVSASDFAGFLEHGPRALEKVPTVWPSLGPGWSRSQVLVPRLDRFLSDPHARAPRAVLQRIVARLCADGAHGDLSQLHGYLRSRVRAHPGESLGELVAATAPGACKTQARAAGEPR